MLFIAHDLAVVSYISDRIGVMYRGKLVEEAPSLELIKNRLHPYTRHLYASIPRMNEKPAIRENEAFAAYWDPTSPPDAVVGPEEHGGLENVGDEHFVSRHFRQEE